MSADPRVAQAEQAVVQTALARGYITQAQVQGAIQQRALASRAGPDPGILPLLRPYLTPEQVHELADVYRSAAGASISTGVTSAGPALPAPPVGGGWREGARVGDLVLGAKLGQGGMGAVYRARSEGGRDYAVKALAAEANPALVTRFQREGEAQARVDAHRNVLRVHRSGQALGHLYLVLDLAEGGDLDGRLASGPLPPDEGAALVRDLAGGLAHVHAQGILHRDLKPANVLFDADGVPKLTDFGLARLAGADRLTATGDLLGTPAYASPEQVSGERHAVDERTDVYGLGAVLYACLTGQAPFAGEGTISTIRKVLDQPPPPPSSVAPGVPPNLEGICLRALAKEPRDRYPTAAAFQEALTRFLAGEDTGERAPSRLGPRLALAGALVAALALGAGLGWGRAGPAPESAPDAASASRGRRGPRGPKAPVQRPREPEAPAALGAVVRGEGWALARWQTPDELRALNAELSDEGLGLVALSANHSQRPCRLAAAWWATSTPHVVRLGMSLEEAGEPPAELPQGARRLLCVAWYPSEKQAGALAYADAWGPSPTAGVPAPPEGVCQTLDQLEAAVRAGEARGARLAWVSGIPNKHAGLIGVWHTDDVPVSYRSYTEGLKQPTLRERGTVIALDGWGAEGLLNLTLWRDDGRPSLFFERQGPEDAAATVAWLQRLGYRPLALLERATLTAAAAGAELAAEHRAVSWSWVRDPRPAALATDGPDNELSAALDPAIRAFLAEHPGATRLALAVTRGFGLALTRGYRLGPPESPPTPASARFRLGPLSSLLGAVAALRLVDAGELSLERPLPELAPGFAAAWQRTDPRAGQVTLEHLLAHRWGGPAREDLLADAAASDDSQLEPRAPKDAEEALARAAALPLRAEPGEAVHLSPVGYLLVARAIERATQTRLNEYVSAQVTGPLRASGFALGREAIGALLPDEVGYEGSLRAVPLGERNVVAPLQYGGLGLDALGPALGWIASAPDLARLVCALHDPDRSPLLPRPAIERMWTRPGEDDSMALGWRTEGPPSDPRAWLTARMPGSAGHVERLPGGTGVVLLANGDVDLAPLAAAIRARLADVEAWPAADLFERY